MSTTGADMSASVAQGAALVPAQHKAALWADADLQVFAVVMGDRVPDLPARLATADIGDFDCLLPGALEPDVQRDAPYLVKLKPDSAFTDWLLFEADADFGEWGLLVRCPARLLLLRNHLRGLRDAALPGGQRIALDWMDPTVFRAVAPLFGSSEITAFFGPVRAITMTGGTAWRHAELQMGRLAQRDVPLLKAA